MTMLAGRKLTQARVKSAQLNQRGKRVPKV